MRSVRRDARNTHRDLETLEALAVPTPPADLADIPKHLWDEHGNKSLNIVWVRELVRLHKEDKQTAHTAAALPMGALNKRIRNVRENLPESVSDIMHSEEEV